MWINAEVDIPRPLIDAQRDGRLVVFAGAGVSMDSPSNLPSFPALAERVADGRLCRLADEPLDRFLGRLKSVGVDVQERTRSIISDPHSKPTELHCHLVDLFPSASRMRIVTTNFDMHFSQVAGERYREVDHYFAPALPLGRSFCGIVYLHGSIKRPEPLVVTDDEFGRAYLSEGWATRMLMEMFSSFTVLFVGYGHEDPVMRYLARSLVGGANRYALTLPGQDDHWTYLGIKPVHFPERPKPQSFGALPAAIRDWVGASQRGAFEHEQRIKDLVQGPPPLDPEPADYVESALTDPVMLRFFVKHARGLEWLDWAEKKGAFRPLFAAEKIETESIRLIGTWLAKTFAASQPKEVLALVQRNGSVMNQLIWWELCDALSQSQPLPEPRVVRAWVMALCAAHVGSWPSRALDHVLYMLPDVGYSEAAVVLFRHLARPRPVLAPLAVSADSCVYIGVEVRLTGDVYYLRKTWEKLIRPNLGAFHREIRPLLSAFITEAHELVCIGGRGNARQDSLSFHRRAIEPHEQDRFPSQVDFLVDAARELIDWLTTNRPDDGSRLLREWMQADAPLLRRLSIYGFAADSTLLPDDALSMVEAENWLYAPSIKHEVFRLIAAAYPKSKEQARRRFVSYSLRAGESSVEVIDDASNEYERYNIAVWLAQVAPDCEIAATHLAKLQKANPDWEPRTAPDLDFWIGKVSRVEHVSPIALEELLGSRPDDMVERLLEFESERVPGRGVGGVDRRGLLDEVQQAASQSFSWGWDLAEALKRRKEWKADLWMRLLDAWSSASRTPGERSQLLALLTSTPELDETLAKPIARFLERQLSNEAEPMVDSELDAAERVLDRLMEPDHGGPTVHTPGRIDWLTPAMNHPAGRVAIAWLQALSARRKAAGDTWIAIPDEYRRRFESVLSGDSHNSTFARIILASQTTFLFAIDPGWSQSHLIPIFSWRQDGLRAEQAWHGFLAWGQWSESLFAAMADATDEAFSHLDGSLSELRDAMCGRLAAAAVFFSADPWRKNGWLFRFVMRAGVESRKLWASSVEEALESLGEDGARAIWGRWLKAYWADRLTSMPEWLTEAEREAMIRWSIPLHSVLHEVVDMVVAAPPPPLETFFLHELQESQLPDQNAPAVGRLLRHLLARASDTGGACDYLDSLVRRLIAHGAQRVDLIAICELMVPLGCLSASELRGLLDTTGG